SRAGVRISCIFQSGASYQTSPIRMSGFPSLLTSATATPSERNFRSTTVFFQVICGGSLSAPKVSRGRAQAGSSRADISQGVVFMSDPRFGVGTWLGMIMRPAMKECNGVAGRLSSEEPHAKAPRRKEGPRRRNPGLAERVAIMAARKVGQYLVNDP